jgi:ElaB/YqjD/DUF883 family membrane-anchored ribosome-binding protein
MAKKKTKVDVKKLQAKAIATAKKEIAKAKAKIAEAEKKVMAYAKKNPKKAMLIAAGVGAAIGAGVALALSRMKKK